MQVVLNMALGEQAPLIEQVMVDLRKKLDFELHDIIAKYERELKRDTDKTHFVVGADKIVDDLTAMIMDHAKDVLQRNYVIPTNGWDTVDELTLRVEEAFTQGSMDLETYVHLSMHETYVACKERGENAMVFQMESLTDLFGMEETMNLENIVKQAKEKVAVFARVEMDQLLSRLQMYKLSAEQVDSIHEMGRGEMTVSRF